MRGGGAPGRVRRDSGARTKPCCKGFLTSSPHPLSPCAPLSSVHSLTCTNARKNRAMPPCAHAPLCAAAVVTSRPSRKQDTYCSGTACSAESPASPSGSTVTFTSLVLAVTS